jgi:hypothetical protein
VSGITASVSPVSPINEDTELVVSARISAITRSSESEFTTASVDSAPIGGATAPMTNVANPAFVAISCPVA